MAKVVLFDCAAGLMGAMALGALVDAGVDADVLRTAVRLMPLPPWELEVGRSLRGVMAGTEARLRLVDPDAACDVAALPTLLGHIADPAVRRRAEEVFNVLAEHTASATVPLATVVEVVGVAAGLAALGVEHVYATLPEDTAVQARPTTSTLPGEVPLFDMTGAAILVGLARLGRPPMRLHRTGYGLESRALAMLDAARVWVGETTGPPTTAPRGHPRPPDIATLLAQTGTRAPLTPPQPRAAERTSSSRRSSVVGGRVADAVLLLDDWHNADHSAYEQLAQALRERLDMEVYTCWTNAPDQGVRATVGRCMERGERRLAVVPLFRTPARQAVAELRGVLDWARGRWPGSALALANPVWTPDHLLGTLARNADDALRTLPDDGPAMLLVVAPPSADEDENAEWFRLGRLLSERRRDPHAEVMVCFSHDMEPDLATALGRCAALGAARVVVLPTCLFAGSTLERTAAEVQAHRGALAHVEVAKPLARVPTAAELIARRVREAVQRPTETIIMHHGHSHTYTWDGVDAATPLLPPRYQDGRTVSAAPMGAAGLVYDAEGKVAWDQIWGDFCDLGLAGGPPHRDTLLEPVDPASVAADPARYGEVKAELQRGLHMVTGLPVVEGAPGWVGLQCADEEMALWMLRAIVVENVSVRREGRTLFLPAGPHFRLEAEIKNVITAVAKTHHYWTEHRAALR